MIAAAFALVRPFLPYILTALAVSCAYLWAQYGWCNHACTVQKKEASTLRGQLDAAQKRATDLALLWSGSVDKTEAAVKAAERKRDADFAALEDRARRVPERVVVFSGIAGSLFTDVTNAANAATAPAVGEGSAPPIPANAPVGYGEREFAAFLVEAGKAYRDARDKWQACVSFYERLQSDEKGLQ